LPNLGRLTVVIEVIELLTSAAFFCKFLPISLLLIFFFFWGRLGSLGGVAGSSLRPASGFLASAVGSRRPASVIFPDSVPPLEDFEPNFAQVRPLWPFFFCSFIIFWDLKAKKTDKKGFKKLFPLFPYLDKNFVVKAIKKQ
jgi:hypothetical protein